MAQVLFRTSHTNPFHGKKPLLRTSGSRTTAAPAPAETEEEKQRRLEGLEKRVQEVIKNVSALKVPNEGTLRILANEAVAAPREHERFPNVTKVLRQYCEIVMGYESRDVVSDYVQWRLMQEMTKRVRDARRKVEKYVRDHIEYKKGLLKHLLDRGPGAVTREEAGLIAEDIMRETLLVIISKADNGDRAEGEKQVALGKRGHAAVLATVSVVTPNGEPLRANCYFILEETPDEPGMILAVRMNLDSIPPPQEDRHLDRMGRHTRLPHRPKPASFH
jgi:hypothetical protein